MTLTPEISLKEVNFGTIAFIIVKGLPSVHPVTSQRMRLYLTKFRNLES